MLLNCCDDNVTCNYVVRSTVVGRGPGKESRGPYARRPFERNSARGQTPSLNSRCEPRRVRRGHETGEQAESVDFFSRHTATRGDAVAGPRDYVIYSYEIVYPARICVRVCARACMVPTITIASELKTRSIVRFILLFFSYESITG